MSDSRRATPVVEEPQSVSLDVRNLDKAFGSTHAVRDVSFAVRRGEVHALLGHNGSGKSTLVKIISGLLKADAGSFSVSSRSGSQPRVGIVHQDLALCGDATVLENCCMSGYRVGRSGFINWPAERRAIEPLLESLVFDFTPDTIVRNLSPANQAIVAIARALKGPPGGSGLDLLILDEATARLRGRDADTVLSTARLVAGQGGGVLLVTHHMAEVLRAADRATVLSNGAVVDTVEVSSTSESGLLEMVSGRRLPDQVHDTREILDMGNVPALNVIGLSGRNVAKVDLSAHHGEIVGVTGAAGAGHEELPYLIAAAGGRQSGRVFIDGNRVRGKGIAASRKRGIGLVPADRLGQGLHLGATVRENLSPVARKAHTWVGLIATKQEKVWAEEVCRSFEVKLRDPEVSIAALSGGNQQKVLLARILEDHPKVIILHEPTQGVDEGTRRGLINLVRQAADNGAAVLYVSSDIEEVVGCSDRVLVFRDGAFITETSGGLAHLDEIYAASYLSGPAAAVGIPARAPTLNS